MRRTIQIALFVPALLTAAYGQTPGKAEFEVASIKMNAAQTGFHFAADAMTGGPGTADPGMFRCSKCSLATLIVKAFNLQPYQFPGRTAVSDNTYEVAARIPSGTTEEQFSGMLQNLLKDRFGLAWHFQEKKMKGYRLVIAKDGPKLKESSGAAAPAGAGQHSFGQGEGHNHSGPMVFGTSATYRATNRTTAELARVLSDQIGFPVDDETGLTGKYDISLRWSGSEAANGSNHGDAGHAGHEGGGGTSGDASGPTLFDALGQQLGLRLVSAEQAVARLFVIDKVAQRPTEN